MNRDLLTGLRLEEKKKNLLHIFSVHFDGWTIYVFIRYTFYMSVFDLWTFTYWFSYILKKLYVASQVRIYT